MTKKLNISDCSFLSMKEIRFFFHFGVLILIIGTVIGLPKFGYAQNITNQGSNIVDIRLQNVTAWPNIHSNVKTDFNPNVTYPQIQSERVYSPLCRCYW